MKRSSDFNLYIRRKKYFSVYITIISNNDKIIFVNIWQKNNYNDPKITNIPLFKKQFL